ncbi:hypothetical protein C7999DRAFT_17058 [Corynascus novoguineensis]|uniref:Uncharacterized protein n=1 Tax=Corynascus novoguineensis TaxID=1126955 RepID=A0AAN7HCH9_9PEZI|nr:hypothetical protein C7999DRAFT_17058 [Corynascus novoguineensis]
MCTIGYTTFTCGCTKPNPVTFKRCEYAKLKGHICPDFQISENTIRSYTDTLKACMRHS